MALLHDLKTIFHLAREVTRVSGRLEELEIEWLDKREAFDRILRRLSMRDVRRAQEGGDGSEPPAEIVEPGASSAGKNGLRHLARVRGLL